MHRTANDSLGFLYLTLWLQCRTRGWSKGWSVAHLARQQMEYISAQ